MNVMLNALKPLAVSALCLLGLSAFAESASAAQWVDSGRSAYLKLSWFGSYNQYTCTAADTPIQDFPGTCATDSASGWTANYSASSGLSNGQVNACGHNPYQLGSACYGLAYAINGQVFAGGLPAACSVGTRAVVTSTSKETVEIQYNELDVDFIESAREYVCQ